MIYFKLSLAANISFKCNDLPLISINIHSLMIGFHFEAYQKYLKLPKGTYLEKLKYLF